MSEKTFRNIFLRKLSPKHYFRRHLLRIPVCNHMVLVKGEAGLKMQDSNSSLAKHNNAGGTIAEVTFDDMHFEGCTCHKCS